MIALPAYVGYHWPDVLIYQGYLNIRKIFSIFWKMLAIAIECISREIMKRYIQSIDLQTSWHCFT